MAGLRSLIRVLSILSIVVSLLAAVLTGAVLYTAIKTATSMDQGVPSFEVSDNKIDLAAPITLTNDGFFTISSFTIITKVAAPDGTSLGEGTTGPFSISAGESTTITHKLTIDLDNLSPQSLDSLLYEDGTLGGELEASVEIAPFADFKLSAGGGDAMEWGAPLGNLRFGDTVVSNHNSTHVLVAVPLSFENRSPFVNIDGKVRATVFNATSNTLVGSGQLDVVAPSGTSFSDRIQTFLELGSDARASLAFQDRTLEFRVDLAIDIAGATINRSESVTYDWGAPLAGLSIGRPDISPGSASSLGISIPFEFDNNSPERLSFSLNTEIFNATSGQSLGRTTTPVSVNSNSRFSGTIDGNLALGSSNMVSLLTTDTTLSFEARFSANIDGAPIALSRNFETEWGAPIKDLDIGSASFGQRTNLTHVALSMPISFTNNSPFLELTGRVQVDFIDTLGQFAGSGSVPFTVPPESSFSGTLLGSISTGSISLIPFTATIKIQTSMGTLEKEMTVSVE